MTTEQKIIRAKVGLLELAKRLGRSAPPRDQRDQFICWRKPRLQANKIRAKAACR